MQAATATVEISHATGPKAPRCNGLFACTGEVYNDRPLFRKVGDPDTWLRIIKNSSWQVTDTENKVANNFRGFCCSVESGLLHPTLAQQWKVHDGSKWEMQAQVAAVVSDKVNYRSLLLFSI